MKVNVNRRKFIVQGFHSATALAGSALWFYGCSPKTEEKKSAEKAAPADYCNDFSNVSENDLDARKKLGYVKESPIPESQCGNCQLWLPPKPGVDCGNCQLFKGPVMTKAYCTYWAPQINEG
jgi:hypothetical protein